MEILLFSFNAIAPLILLLALGFLLVKIRLTDDRFIETANKFCFNVAFPASLFSTITLIDLKNEMNGQLFAFVVTAILLIVVLLLLIVPRLVKGDPQRGALIQGIYRGNFLLLGYPLARNLFGEAGVKPTAMLLPVVIALFNVIAVTLLTYYDRCESKAKTSRVIAGVISNPLIIGALLGAAISLLDIRLPIFLTRAIDDLGQVAVPLALVLLGGQFNWRQATANRRLLTGAVLTRMVFVPAAMTAAAILLGFRGVELGAIFILFNSPTAISSYTMARSMNSDAPLAGQIVLLTTVVSAFTLFGGVSLLRALGYF